MYIDIRWKRISFWLIAYLNTALELGNYFEMKWSILYISYSTGNYSLSN